VPEAEPVPEPEQAPRAETTTLGPRPRASSDEDIWEEADREPEPRVRPPRQTAPGELPERRVVVIDDAGDIDPFPGGAGASRGGDRPGDEDEIGATLHDDEGRKRRWRLFRKDEG
jgi:hypothetical protein